MSIDVDLYFPVTISVDRVRDLVGECLIHTIGGHHVASPGLTYFGPGYSRGDWPAIRAILTRLTTVTGVLYGGGDYPPAPLEITSDLIAEIDALWLDRVAP